MKTFEEELIALSKIPKQERADKVKWNDGPEALKEQISIAVELLKIEWINTFEDLNLLRATDKASFITKLRNSFCSMLEHISTIKEDQIQSPTIPLVTSSHGIFNNQTTECIARNNVPTHSFEHCLQSLDVIEKFKHVYQQFSFPQIGDAYSLLLNCLCPNQVQAIGDGSEMCFTNTLYNKLQQLSALYGFKSNA